MIIFLSKTPTVNKCGYTAVAVVVGNPIGGHQRGSCDLSPFNYGKGFKLDALSDATIFLSWFGSSTMDAPSDWVLAFAGTQTRAF